MKKLIFLFAIMGLLGVSCEDGNNDGSFSSSNNNEQSDNGNSQSDKGQYIPGVWMSDDGCRVLYLSQPKGTVNDGRFTYKYGSFTEYIRSSRNFNTYICKFTGNYYYDVVGNFGKIKFESFLEKNPEYVKTFDFDEISKNNMRISSYTRREEYGFSKGSESVIPSQCDLEKLLSCCGDWTTNYKSYLEDAFFFYDNNAEVRRVKKSNDIRGTYSVSGGLVTCYYNDLFNGDINAFPEIDNIPATVQYSLKYIENFNLTIDGVTYCAWSYSGITPVTVDLENYTLNI
ncbi:MAG: hypothetical protein J6V19_00925 [Alistipes sp.]|nr:hypothetical protein [Alistipes sp.]